jgi:hypothetical protein
LQADFVGHGITAVPLTEMGHAIDREGGELAQTAEWFH